MRVHGWINVPRRLAGSTDGLLIFDSVGGSDLGDRIRSTQGWREFTLKDEPYINNYFGPDGNKPAANVTVLATAMLPPGPLQRMISSHGHAPAGVRQLMCRWASCRNARPGTGIERLS